MESIAHSTRPDRRQQIAVKNGSSVVLLATEDVSWIEADRNYVQFHTSNGCHRIRSTMKEVEAALDPREFVRVHRSTIVNRWAVQEVVREDDGSWVAVLDDDVERRISRRGMERLEAAFEVSV